MVRGRGLSLQPPLSCRSSISHRSVSPVETWDTRHSFLTSRSSFKRLDGTTARCFTCQEDVQSRRKERREEEGEISGRREWKNGLGDYGDRLVLFPAPFFADSTLSQECYFEARKRQYEEEEIGERGSGEWGEERDSGRKKDDQESSACITVRSIL